MADEQVMVVPRSRLFFPGYFHGIKEKEISDYLSIIGEEYGFIGRREAEGREDLQQIIPYLILVRGEEIFTFQRLKAQGESRLHQKISIGLGGHVNPEDLLLEPSDGKGSRRSDPWRGGASRELREEVEIAGDWRISLIALLNDDSNPVGRVHFGLIHRVDVRGECRVRETHKIKGEFVPLSSLSSLLQAMESWSALVVEGLLPQMFTKKLHSPS